MGEKKKNSIILSTNKKDNILNWNYFNNYFITKKKKKQLHLNSKKSPQLFFDQKKIKY